MNNGMLDNFDLKMVVRRMPKNLLDMMKKDDWAGKIFVGGGFIRAVVSGEKVNDVDVFVSSKESAKLLAYELCYDKKDVFTTDNAYTVKGKLPIQIIHRWVFDTPQSVSDSFDFTVCCAVVHYTEGKFGSYCDKRFYTDLASKRLVYRSPVRNEDAGGSMLRVLKYYQRGYRIPLDSLGAVMARMAMAVNRSAFTEGESRVASVLTGLLREVDPDIDPNHIAHLPSSGDDDDTTEQ